VENFLQFVKTAKRFSVTPISIQQCYFGANVHVCHQPAENFLQFGKTAKRFSVTPDDGVFIRSTDAIGMQIGTGMQKIRCNMLHHPNEKGPKIIGFWSTLWKWVELVSLPLKQLKIPHR